MYSKLDNQIKLNIDINDSTWYSDYKFKKKGLFINCKRVSL